MKLNFHEEFLYRLKVAAENRDPVAAWVLQQISVDDHKNVMRGHQNNFRLVKHSNPDRAMEVAYTDFEESHPYRAKLMKRDPDLAYKENQYSVASLSSFLRLFKQFPSLTLRDVMLENFASALNVPYALSYKVSDEFYAFQYAYLGLNYAKRRSSPYDTLNHSCMRKPSLRRIVPEFYKYTCGCKILIALNVMHEVVGRALIWPNVVMAEADDGDIEVGSLVGRMYYTSLGVRNYMRAIVKELGFTWQASMDSNHDWHVNRIDDDENLDYYNFYTRLIPSHLYMGGCPYVDFMPNLLFGEDGNLYLSNSSLRNGMTYLGVLNEVNGGFSSRLSICPNCGSTFNRLHRTFLCPKCMKKINGEADFSIFPILKTVSTDNYGLMPELFVSDGEPVSIAKTAILLNRMDGTSGRNAGSTNESSDYEDDDDSDDDDDN